ncbi:DMT family transporter [Kribbella deserti]|uniref:DMT family transporter n=1 Tax=Kribbella deserti TaxID=1926257 RepID=A0ABV6QJ33_9ACTN
MTTLSAPPVRRTGLLAVGAGTGFVVFWSSGFIGARWGTDNGEVFNLLAWRYLVAATIGLAVLAWRRPRIARADLITQVLMALFSQCAYLGLIFSGVDQGVPAGITALIGALQPILVATVAGPLLGERVGHWQWVGLVLGVGGVGLVVAGDLGAGHAAPAVYLLPFAGVVGLVVGTCLDRRRRPKVGVIDGLAIQCVIAAIFFTTLALGTGQLSAPAAPAFYGAVVWLVLFSTAGGYGFYLLNLRLSGATRISSLMYLVPPATMVWAWLMFGETIGLLAVIGMAVAAVAVLIIRTTGGDQGRSGGH